MADEIMKGMAEELRQTLLAKGLDPKDPPTGSKPPAKAAWGEYKRRGGVGYTDADEFMADLVEEVTK